MLPPRGKSVEEARLPTVAATLKHTLASHPLCSAPMEIGKLLVCDSPAHRAGARPFPADSPLRPEALRGLKLQLIDKAETLPPEQSQILFEGISLRRDGFAKVFLKILVQELLNDWFNASIQARSAVEGPPFFPARLTDL